MVKPQGVKANSAQDVVDLSSRFGIFLDDWQQLILETAMGERADARWAAQRVGVSVPRQNGKSQLLVARALAGALLFGEKKIVVSAHQQDTAREAFAKLMEIIEADANEALRARLDPRFGRGGVMNALNREAVRFKSGATIQFKARSGAGGKGFSSDCLLLDEAQILGSRAWTSINSTMSAMPNPQVWLLGTPPQAEDDSFAFGAVRRSAVAGKSTNAAYLEWSADPDAPDYDPASEYTRWTANPAWNVRINHEVVQGEFETYTPERFAQDRLGVWADEMTARSVVDMSVWNGDGCLDASSKVASAHRFVLDVAPNRAWAAIGVAGLRADGVPHVEVTSREGMADHRPGVEWVVPRAVELAETRPGFVLWVIRGKSAESLVPDLTAAGVDVEFVDSGDVPAACGLFFDYATTARLRHIGQKPLTDALAGAQKNVEDGETAWRWGWRRSAADITPLYAVTIALWVLVQSPAIEPSIVFL